MHFIVHALVVLLLVLPNIEVVIEEDDVDAVVTCADKLISRADLHLVDALDVVKIVVGFNDLFGLSVQDFNDSILSQNEEFLFP